MTNDEKACIFEALICRVQRHSTLIEGMKAENKQREYLGQSMAYCEGSFMVEAEKYEEFAKEFEKLSRR
jgi:hypothetical protein